MDTVTEGRPVCLLGVKLHILTQGATFNLHTRRADAGLLSQSRKR
jgi:cyanophycinase